MTRNHKTNGSINPGFYILLFLSFVVIQPSCVYATGFSIRAPQAGVWVSEGKIYLAGSGATSTTVIVTGVETRSEKGLITVQEGGAFGDFILLSKGMNTIKLVAGDDKAELKVFYSPDPKTANPPRGFKRLFIHKNSSELDCKECHRLRKGQYDYKKIVPARADCTTKCHSDKGKAKHVHGPVGAGVCISCHSPHGSLNPRFIPRTGRKLCTVCHQAGKEKYEHKYAHSLVGKGCIGCHNPHESDVRYQLRAGFEPVSTLCLSCHEKGKFMQEYQHGPVKKGDCLKCHHIHGSDYRNFLPARFETTYAYDFIPASYQVCFECHKVSVFTDMRSVETEFRYEDVNLHYLHVHRENGQGCVTCHDVHSSKQEKIFKGKALFKRQYKVEIQFQLLENGGRCVVGCHKPQQYDRKKKLQRN